MVLNYPHPLAVAERAMAEFCTLWLTGLQPQLFLETSSKGDILVTTIVEAYVEPTLPLHHHPKPKQHSPSQIRRQKKRTLARAAAKLASSEVPSGTSLQVVHSAEKSVQASQVKSPIDAAIQIQPLVNAAATQTDLNCVDTDANLSLSKHHPRPLSKAMPEFYQEHGRQACGDPQGEVLHDLVQNQPQKQALTDGELNETWCNNDYYKYLENQRRIKDSQLKQLSAKIDLGFNPARAKKPF